MHAAPLLPDHHGREATRQEHPSTDPAATGPERSLRKQSSLVANSKSQAPTRCRFAYSHTSVRISESLRTLVRAIRVPSLCILHGLSLRITRKTTVGDTPVVGIFGQPLLKRRDQARYFETNRDTGYRNRHSSNDALRPWSLPPWYLRLWRLPGSFGIQPRRPKRITTQLGRPNLGIALAFFSARIGVTSLVGKRRDRDREQHQCE